jgi:hypothetical protein
MNGVRLLPLSLVLVAALGVVAACGGESTGGAGVNTGQLGGACKPDGTCSAGLACSKDLCVRAAAGSGGAGGSRGTADAGAGAKGGSPTGNSDAGSGAEYGRCLNVACNPTGAGCCPGFYCNTYAYDMQCHSQNRLSCPGAGIPYVGACFPIGSIPCDPTAGPGSDSACPGFGYPLMRAAPQNGCCAPLGQSGIFGCVDPATNPAACAPGITGHPCYPDGTCGAGLVCSSSRPYGARVCNTVPLPSEGGTAPATDAGGG